MGNRRGREQFRRELDSVRQFERRLGIPWSVSYVFPRNKIGYLEMIKAHHWKTTRAPRDDGSFRLKLRPVEKLVRYSEYFLAVTPPVYPIYMLPCGLLVTRGSYCFIDALRAGAVVPTGCRVRSVVKGIEQAVRKTAILHLWLHDYVLSRRKRKMLSALENVAEYIKKRRDEGIIEVLTMGDCAVPNKCIDHKSIRYPPPPRSS